MHDSSDLLNWSWFRENCDIDGRPSIARSRAILRELSHLCLSSYCRIKILVSLVSSKHSIANRKDILESTLVNIYFDIFNACLCLSLVLDSIVAFCIDIYIQSYMCTREEYVCNYMLYNTQVHTIYRGRGTYTLYACEWNRLRRQFLAEGECRQASYKATDYLTNSFN